MFTAGGLFYYFEKEQMRRLFCAMAERFPGGMITFDTVNALGLKGVNVEVKLAGEQANSFFFVGTAQRGTGRMVKAYCQRVGEGLC